MTTETLHGMLEDMKVHKEAAPFENFAAIALEHAIKPYFEGLSAIADQLQAVVEDLEGTARGARMAEAMISPKALEVIAKRLQRILGTAGGGIREA